MNKLGEKTHSSEGEEEARKYMLEILKESPLPDDQILPNLGLFLNSKTLARINFMQHIYQKIVDTQGVVMDFGTRWGQNMTIFSSCRGMYEPFNRHRKIIGFDTFSGFPSVTEKDGKSDLMVEGNATVTEGYEKYLEKLLCCHEDDNPLGHIKKFEVIKGDAIETLAEYLDKNPQTIISLAYFDFDIYSPTKKCLKMISPHLMKGSIIGFDELNDEDSPGETVAFREVFNTLAFKIEKLPYVSRCSYIEMGA